MINFTSICFFFLAMIICKQDREHPLTWNVITSLEYSEHWTVTNMERGPINVTIIAGIEICLSIACMVMGGVHLNECHNQAAIFLLVNGGVTLPIAILVISFFWADKKNAWWTLSFACLVKLGLAIYGSVVVIGKFQTQLIWFKVLQYLFQDHRMLTIVMQQPLPSHMRWW